jgi:hypothetical protein
MRHRAGVVMRRFLLRLRARFGLHYAQPLTPMTWRDPQGCIRLPLGHRTGWADRAMADAEAARLERERNHVVTEGWTA